MIRSHGADVVVSDNRYLDVLPPGVNKGSTLLALLEWLEIGHGSVVTAGDTLNDLAMFETGLKGVMVGNAEPPWWRRSRRRICRGSTGPGPTAAPASWRGCTTSAMARCWRISPWPRSEPCGSALPW